MFPSGVWISWGAGTPQFTLTTCSLLWILWKWHSNTGTHQVSSVVSLSDPLSVLLSPPHCEPQSRISGLLPGQLSPPGVCGQWWPHRCRWRVWTPTWSHTGLPTSSPLTITGPVLRVEDAHCHIVTMQLPVSAHTVTYTEHHTASGTTSSQHWLWNGMVMRTTGNVTDFRYPCVPHDNRLVLLLRI